MFSLTFPVKLQDSLIKKIKLKPTILNQSDTGKPPVATTSSATSFSKHQKFQSQIAILETSCKRPLLLSDGDRF